MTEHLYGLEAELPEMHQAPSCLFSEFPHEVADDGSIRANTYRIGDIPIVNSGKYLRDLSLLTDGLLPERGGYIGVELAFEPLDFQNALELADRLKSVCASMPQSNEAAIHIHKGMENKSFREIQLVLKWTYYLEAILFSIAKGNYPLHRGMSNNFKYARPLSSPITWHEFEYGAPVQVPLLHIKKILEAKSFSEMLAYWGRLDYYWNQLHRMRKWIPQRLAMISILPLAKIGTLEYRLWNACYESTKAFLHVVEAIHTLAEHGIEPDYYFDIPLVLGYQPDAQDMNHFKRVIEVAVEQNKAIEFNTILGSVRDWVKFNPQIAAFHHYKCVQAPKLQSTDDINLVYNNNAELDTMTPDFIVYVK